MTGRAPTTAVDLVLFSGPNLKDAVRHGTTTEVVDRYCNKLAESLARLHEAVRDENERLRRRQALREANKGPGMHFEAGDYVMVCASGNQANVQRHSKTMVKWQGPYVVLGPKDGSPAEFHVRLVGTDESKDVHWRKMRRLAGPGLVISQAVQNSALHDRQRFVVECFDDWGIDEDGVAKILVRWRGFDDDERTWEPLAQLYEDVKVLVTKYVAEQDEPVLHAALNEVKDDPAATTAAAATATAAAASAVNTNPHPNTRHARARNGRRGRGRGRGRGQRRGQARATANTHRYPTSTANRRRRR